MYIFSLSIEKLSPVCIFTTGDSSIYAFHLILKGKTSIFFIKTVTESTPPYHCSLSNSADTSFCRSSSKKKLSICSLLSVSPWWHFRFPPTVSPGQTVLPAHRTLLGTPSGQMRHDYSLLYTTVPASPPHSTLSESVTARILIPPC